MKLSTYVLLALTLLFMSNFGTAKRVALVMGNADYQYIASLENATNDAIVIANSLIHVGFTVTLRQNLDKHAMRETVREFKDEISEGDTVFIYYGGYGTEISGEGFLIPVDASMRSLDEVEDFSMSVDYLTDMLDENQSQINIYAFDMNYNLPSPSKSRDISNLTDASSVGLKEVISSSNQFLISYPSLSGEFSLSAIDGTGNNKPYAHALKDIILNPNLSYIEAFSKLTAQVYTDTNGLQQPWFSASITDLKEGFSGSIQTASPITR